MSHLVINTWHTDEELLGKYVKVVSNASYKHYRNIGRIVGFSTNKKMVEVYFSDTDIKTRFYRDSLELLN